MRGKGKNKASEKLTKAIAQMKAVLKLVPHAKSLESLLGYEGNLAALYFDALPDLISPDVPAEMGFDIRNRRPLKIGLIAFWGLGTLCYSKI